MVTEVVTSVEEVSRNDEIVYDIGIEDTHCFFANGILVHNSPHIIIDESDLIPDDIYSKIKRMLGGQKDNFLFEISNPWNRGSHFFKACHNPKYKKIWIDYNTALEEGRYTKEFIEEMRNEANFDSLYACKFPEEGKVDEEGWSSLVSYTQLQNAQRKDNPTPFGPPRLGVDISGSGENFNVWVLRYDNHARILARISKMTHPEIAGQTIRFAEEYNVDEKNIFLDSTGNSAIPEILHEKGWDVPTINVAEVAETDPERYLNVRAEAYFKLERWLRQGATLEESELWLDLLDIKHKVRESNGKTKIISKEELRKRNIASTDVADSLMLTFTRDDIPLHQLRARKQAVLAVRASRPSFE